MNQGPAIEAGLGEDMEFRGRAEVDYRDVTKCGPKAQGGSETLMQRK